MTTPNAPEAPEGADFASLAETAAQLDAGQAPRPGAAAAPPADPLQVARAEASELVDFAASLLLPLVALKSERIAAAYGPAELQRIAEALAKVAAKRGWSVGDMVGQYGPELALAAALAGPVLPIALEEAKRRRQAPAAAPSAPGARQVEAAPDPVPVPEVREWKTGDDGRIQ